MENESILKSVEKPGFSCILLSLVKPVEFGPVSPYPDQTKYF